jgi:hypothetical protein
MQNAAVREKADRLLLDWYEWSRQYRPDLDAPGCSPACRDSRTSRQWDSTTDIAREVADRMEMQAVQDSYDAIPLEYRSAIGVEMRNKLSKAKVWRSPYPQTYDEALDLIIPQMRKRGLIEEEKKTLSEKTKIWVMPLVSKKPAM